VVNFQAMDSNTVNALGSDGNLWYTPGPFGQVPNPNRIQVDGNVVDFQAVDSNTVYVRGSDGNIWYTPASFGQVPNPNRIQVTAFGEVPNQNPVQVKCNNVVVNGGGTVADNEVDNNVIVNNIVVEGADYPEGLYDGVLWSGGCFLVDNVWIDGKCWYGDKSWWINRIAPVWIVDVTPIVVGGIDYPEG